MAKQICTYCGSSWKIEEDHVQARSKRGVLTVGACKACNGSKGNKALMEWLRWLKQNNSYRFRRIVKHNKGRRNFIAKKVQKVRDENG